MTDRLRIAFVNHEGAVLRLLGLVERRGFRIVRVAMDEGEHARATMTLEIDARDPARSLETLSLQIRRLHDVDHVACFSTPMASAA